MATHAAFLRGINLGKSRRVRNEALIAALEGIGLEEVACFRASGNVVFTAKDGPGLQKRIEAGLRDALGFEVVVFLRSARQVRAIARHEPFEKPGRKFAEGKLQVALLPKAPSAAKRREALGLAGDDDLVAIRGAELYWLPAGRTIESALDLKKLEAAAGAWTMRTMGTIEAISGKFFG